MKNCNKCGQQKSRDSFYMLKNKNGIRLSAYCQICHRMMVNKYRLKNLESIRARKKVSDKKNRKEISRKRRLWRIKWNQKNPEKYKEILHKYREYRLKKEYGLTPSQYQELLTKQNRACAICHKPFVENARKTNFGVDHCHKTGKVRGLLCYHCNAGLGMVGESPEILMRMIDYLRKHK